MPALPTYFIDSLKQAPHDTIVLGLRNHCKRLEILVTCVPNSRSRSVKHLKTLVFGYQRYCDNKDEDNVYYSNCWQYVYVPSAQGYGHSLSA